MWKETIRKDWGWHEAKWIENGETIIFIESIGEGKYAVKVKGTWCKSYKYNYVESDIDVAKLKGLIAANIEGWKINNVV